MGQTYSGKRKPSWMEDSEGEEDVSDCIPDKNVGAAEEENNGRVVLKSEEVRPCSPRGRLPCRKSLKEPAAPENTCTSSDQGSESHGSVQCKPDLVEQPKTSPSPSLDRPGAPSEKDSLPSLSSKPSDNHPTTDKISDTKQSLPARDTPP